MSDALGLLPQIPNQIDVKIAMQDLYEIKYGIFNHLGTGGSRPMSSVAFHPCEDVNHESMLQVAMEKYIENNIHDHFHVSFLEFMSLPTDITAMMHEIAVRAQEKKAAELKEIEAKLAAAGKS